MKKLFIIPFTTLLLLTFTACQKKDINALKNEVNDLKNRVTRLEDAAKTLNADIQSLKTIATALQAKISVVSYAATATGYELIMSDGSKINLTNGKDGINGTNGKDGINAPLIGLKQDADANYYWTIGGDWLLQNGQKVRANGTDGNDGADGSNGVTPLLMVNTTSNQWMVSYDNGNTWSVMKDSNGNPVTATGAQGQPGPTGPQGPAGVAGFGITETPTAIIITYNGNTYLLPTNGGQVACNMGDLPSVTYRGASVALSNDAKALLASAAQSMRNNPNCKIVVTGYCAGNNTELQLSWDRVEQTISHLSEKEGISRSRFIFKYGAMGGDCNTVDLRAAAPGENGTASPPAPYPNLSRI